MKYIYLIIVGLEVYNELYGHIPVDCSTTFRIELLNSWGPGKPDILVHVVYVSASIFYNALSIPLLPPPLPHDSLDSCRNAVLTKFLKYAYPPAPPCRSYVIQHPQTGTL